MLLLLACQNDPAPTQETPVEVPSVEAPVDAPTEGPVDPPAEPAEPAPGPVTVTVTLDPPADGSGTLWLTGFDQKDPKSHFPLQGAEPISHTTLVEGFTGDRHEVSLTLDTAAFYLALYGSGDHPQPGDRMSFLTGVDGSALELSIADAAVPADGEKPPLTAPPVEATDQPAEQSSPGRP